MTAANARATCARRSGGLASHRFRARDEPDGTSAITRILALTGMSLPPDLLAANDANPTGYWEPAEAVALNDRFLERRRSSYYDPTLFVQSDDTAFDASDAREFVDAIATFVDTHRSDAPLVIKDPRLVALAPYWYRGAVRAGRTVHCILPVRDPQAVVASIMARDGVSFAYANVLWLKYTLLAERGSRRFPRVFVDYARMIADWGEQVRRVSRALGIASNRRRRSAVDAFVDPRLDHSARRMTGNEALLPLTAAVRDEVARAALGLPLDQTLLDAAFAIFQDRESAVAGSGFRAGVASVRDRAKWDALGVRLARALAKGPPFQSA